MTVQIREAGLADLEPMSRLLVEDGRQRAAVDPTLWRMRSDAFETVRTALATAMKAGTPPVRQQWLLAEASGTLVGVAHTILLPVPPIYEGAFGRPGLIMEDCFVTGDAPAGTLEALLEAAESDLVESGAKILLGASVAGGIWERALTARAYEPLTLYLAKVGLRLLLPHDGVAPATADDVPDIVTSSSRNRQILFDLDPFWKPHPDADARFGAWMHKSLTLSDRDMFVSRDRDALTGYAISQPATSLHFPAPHDIGAIGVIDDYYHAELADPAMLRGDGAEASRLLKAAEAALTARGNDAALVVCPAAWRSKIAVLEAAGYRTAISWFKKRGPKGGAVT